MIAGEADQGTAIIARNASKLFLDGTVVAFRQLTLSVRHQEILCIVGPSGCGKTTFLRSIACLTDLSSGELRVGDKPVRGPPEGVAMVFQHFGLLPGKTVFENAPFGLKLAGRIKEVIDVPFGWPRDVEVVRADPRFAELRAHIWRQLHTARPQRAAKVA